MSSEQERSESPFGIVLSYILVAAAWILFSDMAVARLIPDPTSAGIISLVKGWVFVAVTATLLYVIIGRKIRVIEEANRQREEAVRLRLTEGVEQERRFDAEARMERSLLKTLVGTIPDLVWLKDADGVFLTCNQAFERFFGAKEADIIGKTDYDFVDAELADFFRAKDRQAMAAGKASRNDEWVTFADDNRRALLETIKAPMVDSDGRLIGVLGIARDVTATRQAQEERETVVAFLRMVNSSSDKAEMIRAAVTFFQQQSGCEAVGMRLKEGDDYPYFEYRGFTDEFIQSENTLCDHDEGGNVVRDSSGNPVIECMCGNVICGRFDPEQAFFTTSGSFWSNCTTDLLASTTEPDRQARTRNRCNGEGYESVALLALKVGEEQLGLLQLNDRQKDRFSTQNIALWERLAGYLAVAVAKFSAEEALRESEAIYRSLFDNMLNGFAYCRMLYEQDEPRDFIYLCVNDAFAKLTGLQDVVGRKVTEIIPGIRESDPELFEIYGRVALTGKPERFERYVAALHAWYWISVYSPKKEHFVAVFDVITERKRAEESLRKSEQRFRLAMDATSDGLWDWDVVNGQVYYNPGYFRMLGYEPGELPATLDTWLALVHPEDRDRAMAAKQACIRNEAQTFDAEFRMRSRIGEWRWILGRGKAVRRDTNGRALQMIGTHVDITERKLAEAEREKVERLESLGLLAGGIAHDFNNILTAVIGNVSLARMRIRVDHGADERLADSEKALDRAVELVRQLHTFSRGGAPVKGVVDLEQLLREVVSFALHGSNCKGQYVIAEGLRHLDADVGQIHQALNNLIINAVQAMPEGGVITVAAANVTVENGADPQLSPGHYVKITISDQGTGIAAENLGRIFDPYFTTKPTGTGIGLASVFSIVRRHDGSVGVSSVPGKGAAFTILLPAVDLIASSAEPTAVIVAQHPVEKSVLVMDDEEMIRSLADEILKELGYSPVTCMNGAEAVDLYRATLAKGTPFAAVILDMTIPGGMGGKEAAARILEIDPNAVLIISSGYSVDTAYGGEADPVFSGAVSKPYSVRQIAGELARLTTCKPS